ncbi:uncharacterized protein LOC135486491 isoform X1 [Lineus longissimus]|uniref:uncharacterized protein LOC135486491 isoform X1 n=1 Tax=Lineus longissimus TaxID=88925 RepID=UPI002B4E7A00
MAAGVSETKKSLMSHEITRAKLRLLTPISEEARSPRANIKTKNMVAITDRLDVPQAAEESPAMLDVLKQLQDLQKGNPGDIISDPNDLKTVVEGYLNDPRYLQGRRQMHRAPQPTLIGHRPVHCDCCAHINKENRERRMGAYPEQYGYWTDTPSPIEIVPYGSPGRGPVLGKYSSELVPVRGQLPALQNPGSEPLGMESVGGPRIQVLYPNYEGNRPMNWNSNQTGQYDSMLFPTHPGVGQGGGYGRDGERRAGSALAMYPYLPRNMHNYNHNDYDIYGLHSIGGYSSDNERYLMEDVMEAARRYDNSMNRLQGKIDTLTPRYSQEVRYKGRFDGR